MPITLHRFLTKDPQRSYKWRIVFPSDVNIDPLLAESCSVPHQNNDVETVHYGGGDIKLPDYRSVDQISFDLMETSDGQVLKAINKWKRLIQDDKHEYGLPTQYKKDLLCQIVNNFNVVHTEITLVGCWPTITSSLSLSYTESSKVIISQSFAVDSIISKEFGLLESLRDLKNKFILPNLSGIGLNLFK